MVDFVTISSAKGMVVNSGKVSGVTVTAGISAGIFEPKLIKASSVVVSAKKKKKIFKQFQA